MCKGEYYGKRECNELIDMNDISCVNHRNMCNDRQLVSEFNPNNLESIQSTLLQQNIYDGKNRRDPTQYFKQKDDPFFEMMFYIM